jgi:hypothetical protein
VTRRALLAYTLGTVPDPLQAGGQGTLELTVQNASHSVPVTLIELDVTLPLGTDATSLCASSKGIATVKPDDTWTVDHDEGSPVFKFCAPAGGVVLKGQSISLRLLDVAVNETPGTTAPVQVTAITGDSKDPVTETFSQPLEKFPAQFSLDDPTQDPTTPIPWGGEVTLKWTGTADPAYPPACTLDRSDSGGGTGWPQKGLGVSGSCDVTNLTPDGEFVLFTLTATMAVPGQSEPLVAQRQHTVTVEAPAPKIDLFTASVDVGRTPPQLTVTWCASHTGSVVFPELGSSQFHGEGTTTVAVTADAPLPTTLTMCAYPQSGFRSSMTAVAPDRRTLRPTWGVLATNPNAGDPGFSVQDLALTEVSLVAAVEGTTTNYVIIVDPWSLSAMASLPTPPPLGAIAASPDGTRVYLTEPNDFSNTRIFAFDATQSPPVQVGAPVDPGTRSWCDLVFLPDGVTPYGPTLLSVDRAGSVTPYPAGEGGLGTPRPAIPFPPGSSALSADGTRLYGLSMLSEGGGSWKVAMQVLDLRTLEVGPVCALADFVQLLAPAPGESVVAYTGTDPGFPAGLYRFDPEPPFTVRAFHPLGETLFIAVMSADGRSVYLAHKSARGVTVLDADTLTAVGPVDPGMDIVDAVVVSPDGARIYLAAASTVTMMTPSGYA